MKQSIKKTFKIIMSCVLILPAGHSLSYAAHTGSESDPLPINSGDDLNKVMELVRTGKNWSNGKHFSLKQSIKFNNHGCSSDTLGINSEGHRFCGIFHGNGHTIKIVGSSGGSLFGYIGEGAVIENLTVTGQGNFAQENKGTIRGCTATPISVNCGMVYNNKGKIENCTVNGVFTGSGIAQINEGEINRCVVVGDEDATGNYGLAEYNTASGKIAHCRVRAGIKGAFSEYSHTSGLVGTNDGLVENCTMNGHMEGDRVVYLVGLTKKSESMVRRSVVGKGASGAYKSRMFGPGYGGQVEDCGYEGWDQEDHCDVK